MKWTKRRVRELEELRKLLIEASSIDHGSHATDRIRRCEKMANRLMAVDLAAGRASFMDFLVSLANAERSKPPAMVPLRQAISNMAEKK